MAILQRFIDSIQSFFLKFFLSPEEYKRQRALKQMRVVISSETPSLYRSDNMLMPAFADLIYELDQHLLPLKNLFTHSLTAADARTAAEAQNLLIEHALSEEQQQLHTRMQITNRRTEIMSLNSEQAAQKIQEQGKDLQMFLALLTTDEFKMRDREWSDVLMLANLCFFDFNALLSHFDESFVPHIGKMTTVHSTNFRPASAEVVLPNLLDFNFVLAPCVASDYVIQNLILLPRPKTGDVNEQHYETLIKRAIQFLASITSNRLSRQNMHYLLCLAQNDPEFVESSSYTPVSILEEYIQRKTDSFSADSRKLLNARKNEQLYDSIKQIFSVGEVIPVAGYTDELNVRLEQYTSLSFEWVLPLKMIKSFARYFFLPSFQPFLHELLIEGFFTDKEFERQCAEAYHSCESVPEKIAEFEQLLKSGNKCSLESITGFLDEIEKGGGNMEKRLKKLVDPLNISARNLVQSAGESYIKMNVCVTNLVDDSKRSVPALVSNIKTLAHSVKNKKHFFAMEARLGAFNSFIEIIKNFTIVEKKTHDTAFGEN